MPASFYSHEISIRRDSVDAHPVVGSSPDHASNSGTVMIGCKRLLASLNKVNRLNNSIGKVRMACIDTGINHSYANTTACYPGVSSVGAHDPRPILKRRVGISSKRSQPLKNLVQLD
jgi:hypothetical protein